MASRSTASSRPGVSPAPAARVNQNLLKVLGQNNRGRILCLADVRGHLSNLNELASENDVVAIIHTGDFGFFDSSSLSRINDRTLRHLILYSPLISNEERDQLLADGQPLQALRNTVTTSSRPILSEFPKLLSGEIKLAVPVYTVWGACEDVTILERLRSGEYEIENLHVIDEATSRCLDVGGVKLRLLGLGGALVPHKMFDNGEGNATIAGGQGTMWTTALQIGELVDTAQRTYDHSETRLLVSHASPGREGIIAQLALVLKADLTVSAGLHFRYASSYNEFSVQGDMEGFRQKLSSGKESFSRVWENVKTQVEAIIDENQRILLEKCLSVVERVPPAHGGTTAEEPAWKNCWNWNLCDAAYGHLILDINQGRVSCELKSQGFNYAYRRKSDPALPVTNVETSVVPSAPMVSSDPQGLSTSSHPANGNADTAPKTNGASVASTAPGSPTSATADRTNKRKPNKKEKEREREKREEEKKASPAGAISPPLDRSITPATVAAKHPLPRSNVASPASPAPSSSAQRDQGLLSPTGESESTGGRTPLTSRPRRNPNTLFLGGLPVPVTEDEIRDFFGPARAGITHIKIPLNHASRQQKPVAFVEFGDKEVMEEGLGRHSEKFKGVTIEVSIAEDRSQQRDGPGGESGRGRGRGGFRGSGRGRGPFNSRNGVVAAAAAAASGRIQPGDGVVNQGKPDERKTPT
ncbi:uncharacterized protein EI90DRAFT_2993369 [Cantharellus anzutake]|uniref:uncharacterized protein n=1 Tax=Cantharellus anzutake TaxID=1750568 RepID=UPI001907FBE0|nr:uncharacterized protein EI90DRAFT_2993369 [Cantharellus anzutake]KAF8334973.1 hypothetical protein EI90DRAFT_2993369 [Cantharellus anzutake]